MPGEQRDPPKDLAERDGRNIAALAHTMSFCLSRQPPTYAAVALACTTAALLVGTHSSDAGVDEWIDLLRHRIAQERRGQRSAAS